MRTFCEQCEEREATVHLTVVVGSSAEATKHNYCDSCYPAAEAQRVKTYNRQPDNPLPTDVEHITALEYLEASARAVRNGADKPAFKHINEALKRFPKTRQRLVFEMLNLAWQSLERGEDPRQEAGFAGCCRDSIEAERMPEYITWLERIVIRCFELRSQLPNPETAHGPFALTPSLMLISLGKVDRARFSALVEDLKNQCSESQLDWRRKVLSRATKLVLQSENQGL